MICFNVYVSEAKYVFVESGATKMVVFPHAFILCPPNVTSFVFDLRSRHRLICSYVLFEITLHWAPVSNLNVMLQPLRFMVALQSLVSELFAIAATNGSP